MLERNNYRWGLEFRKCLVLYLVYEFCLYLCKVHTLSGSMSNQYNIMDTIEVRADVGGAAIS